MAQQKKPQDSDATAVLTPISHLPDSGGGAATRPLSFEDEATVPFSPVQEPRQRQMREQPKVTKLENLDAYGDGNWENPHVLAPYRQREAPTHTATDYRDQAHSHMPAVATGHAAQQPRTPHAQVAGNLYAQPSPLRATSKDPSRPKPLLSKTRRFFCLLFVPLFLFLGASSALAYWVQKTLVSPNGFAQVSVSMAYNSDFQNSLAGSAAEDLMQMPSVQAVLGDGNSTAWYGPAQNWLYDRVNTAVHNTAYSLVNTDTYPQVWEQTMNDTHAYIFNGETKPAALDLSYLYSRIDQTVGQPYGIDLTPENNQHLVLLDSADGTYPLNTLAQGITSFANSWQILTVATAGLGLFLLMLWPGNRLLFAAIVGFIGAGLLWIGGFLAQGSSWVLDAFQIPTGTGITFIQQLTATLSDSLAAYNASLVGSTALVSAILLALAIACAVVGLTVKGIAGRSLKA